MEPNISPEARSNRARGWVLIVLGPMLCLAMAVISFSIWRTIHFQGQLGSTSRWNGSAEMTARTFQLFGTIFVFGLVCVGAGIYQLRTGRRNLIFVVALLVLVGVMIFLGRNVMQLAR